MATNNIQVLDEEARKLLGIRLGEVDINKVEYYFATDNNFLDFINKYLKASKIWDLINQFSDEQKIALDIKHTHFLGAEWIVQTELLRFVTDADIAYWNSLELSANERLDEAINNLLDGVVEDLNTLNKIALSINNDPHVYQTLDTRITNEFTAIRDGVVERLDTLNKLALSINNDPHVYETINTRIDNEVSTINTNMTQKYNTLDTKINTTRDKIYQDMDAAILQEKTTRENEDTDIRTELRNKDTAMKNYVDGLNANMEEALANEASTRESEDTDIRTELRTKDTAMKNYVDSKDTAMKTYVDTKDSTMKNYVDTKDSTMKNYVDGLNSDMEEALQNEINTRTSEDTDIRTELRNKDSAMKTYVDNKDSTMKTYVDDLVSGVNSDITDALASEIATRESEDTNIRTELRTKDSAMKSYVDTKDSTMKNYVDGLNSDMNSALATESSTRASEDEDIRTELRNKDSAMKTYVDTKNTEMKNYVDNYNSNYESHVNDELDDIRSALATETSTRASEDTSIRTELTNKDTAMRTYVNNKDSAMKTYVDGRFTSLINDSPEALDTLRELSEALGNDPNFATTITNLINNNKTASNALISKWVGNIIGNIFALTETSPDDYDGYVAMLNENPSYKALLNLTALANSIGWDADFKTTVENAIDAVVDTDNTSLNTIGKLENAIGHDSNFSTSVYNAISTKVDKVSGKALSTNDFTNELLNKLNNLKFGIQDVYVYNENGERSRVFNGSAVDYELHIRSGENISVYNDGTGHSLTIKGNYKNATSSAGGLMSASDKAKLDGIQSGGEVNQNAFSRVTVGSTNIDADTKTDALTIVAGSNISITPDATNDKITIAGNYSTATQSANGLMSSTDKTKLDGVATGAEVNQNSFGKILVGTTTIEADAKVDTLTIVAGNSNITITPDATNDKITISTKDTTYSDATQSVHGLMSIADKTKLDGVATGAEVNQNAFSKVTVGSTTVEADSKTDTLTLVAGSNITITPDADNDKITIAAKDTTYSTATQSANGLMSSTDKTKLDGVATGAEVNQNAFSRITVDSTNIDADTKSDALTLVAGTNITLTPDATNDKVTITAKDTTYSNATTSTAGLMSTADKTKLDGIATGANAYTHPTSHPATMITADASHRFVTDTQISAWNAKIDATKGTGSFAGSNGETKIAHGLGTTPTNVQVTPSANGSGAIGEFWARADATYIYVGNSGSATTGFYWIAFK